MTNNIPLFNIYWDEGDVQAAEKVIRRGSHWAIGPEIEEFEKNLAAYVGVDYAVTFNTGTSALHAVLLAYGISQGDEVIVPSFTFISTANSPFFVGAKPIFADIEEKTLAMDAENLESKINDKTKALMPIHYGGCPAFHTKEFKQIAKDKKIIFIEDAAEALGAKVDNHMVGTFGDSAMVSFCQNKIITTGEGGAIVSNDRKLCEKLKSIRSHGRSGDNYFASPNATYLELGYNFRMPSMLAAIGISQLNKIDSLIAKRREIAAMYNKKLSSNHGLIKPTQPDNFQHIYQMYTLRVNENLRDGLINHLRSMGISSKIYFEPVHLSDFYTKEHGHVEGEMPITEQISRQALSLPIYPNMETEEVSRVAEEINKYLEGEVK